MKNSDITDPLFRDAVEAIDSGNTALLQHLLETNPQLVTKRLITPTEGYFRQPYLLWFVADNPVRHEKLPANIVEITSLLIRFVRQNARESFQKQIDYTFGLVETGRIPRECGVQVDLIDLLIDNGVTPGNAQGALANGNIEAAKHIIERSGKITLPAAVCLNRIDEVKRLSRPHSRFTIRSALTVAPVVSFTTSPLRAMQHTTGLMVKVAPLLPSRDLLSSQRQLRWTHTKVLLQVGMEIKTSTKCKHQQ
ncbi:MAG: hypothetical protein WKG06_04785 [Segetibacter sp.]